MPREICSRESPQSPCRRGVTSPRRLPAIFRTGLAKTATLSTTAYASFTVKDFYLRHPDCKTAICVQVEAFQWAWNFTYPNGKNVVGLLRVPQDTPIVLNVTSNDVFHSFSIQSLRVKTDAIRGRRSE